jgi:hypothetical protein
VIDVDYDRSQIASAIERHMSNGRYQQNLRYGNGQAGRQIARLLAEVPLKIEKRLTY